MRRAIGDQTIIRAERLPDALDVSSRVHRREMGHQLARRLDAPLDERRVGARDRLEFGDGGRMGFGAIAGGTKSSEQRMGLLCSMRRGSKLTTSHARLNSSTCCSLRESPPMILAMPAPGPPGMNSSTPLRCTGSRAGTWPRRKVNRGPPGPAGSTGTSIPAHSVSGMSGQGVHCRPAARARPPPRRSGPRRHGDAALRW